ncbi:Hypothetical predicted protein [Olea europaea subsp. europaea]|uniref:Uncharacterized protein n=1 Tax=Olea europaea subsp. europaea TaxID=158383 RepID=A0A8S0QE93_OLEEU|nr:Hypothetical predicted protein [Olea europaea subsp. europaea]
MTVSIAAAARIAVSRFSEEFNKNVEILQFDDEFNSIKPATSLSIEHTYPPTKPMSHPAPIAATNLLAPSGYYLRHWELRDASIEPICTFNNDKTSEFCLQH